VSSGSISAIALVERARATPFGNDPALIGLIDRSLATARDPRELGYLYIARALANQGNGDPSISAASARAAVPHLLAVGDVGSAAYASAVAAVWLDQAREAGTAIDCAVDALMMLADVELAAIDAVRASLAMCGFFSRLSAFDLAIGMGERAFDGALELDGVPIDSVAFTVGYVAAEGGHVAATDEARERRLATARRAVDWLLDNGTNEVSRVISGEGLDAEIRLAAGDDVSELQLGAAASLYEQAAPDLVAWHQLVRGTVAARHGDPASAVELLVAAEPGLRASGDYHCLVRALHERAEARAELGDAAGAYADAVERAEFTRRWQLDHATQFAAQIARRVDLTKSTSRWRSTAEQLAHDADWDPTTGVRSRRWFDDFLDRLTTEDRQLSILVLDLDRFKSVNDTYGHAAADAVLRRVGAVLNEEVGPDVDVARFGGDEFVVVFCDADHAHVEQVGEAIRWRVAATEWGDIADGLDLTISGGIAHGCSSSPIDVFSIADSALLEAKRSGRNSIAVGDDAVGAS
jgi:diguanylate cyclase (GGDEF)-like protein